MSALLRHNNSYWESWVAIWHPCFAVFFFEVSFGDGVSCMFIGYIQRRYHVDSCKVILRVLGVVLLCCLWACPSFGASDPRARDRIEHQRPTQRRSRVC